MKANPDKFELKFPPALSTDGRMWTQPEKAEPKRPQVVSFTPIRLMEPLHGVTIGLASGDDGKPITLEKGVLWNCRKGAPPERVYITCQIKPEELEWSASGKTKKVLACVPFLINDGDRSVFPLETDKEGKAQVFVPIERDGHFWRTNPTRNYIMFLILTADGFVMIVTVCLRVQGEKVLLFKQATRMVQTFRNAGGLPEVPAFTRIAEPKPRWEKMSAFIADLLADHTATVATWPKVEDWTDTPSDASTLESNQVLVEWASARRWVAGATLGKEWKGEIDGQQVTIPAGTPVKVPFQRMQLITGDGDVGSVVIFEGAVMEFTKLVQAKGQGQYKWEVEKAKMVA